MKTRSTNKTPFIATLDKIKTEIRKTTRSVVLDNSLRDLEKLVLNAINQEYEEKNNDGDGDQKHCADGEQKHHEEELENTRKIVSVLSSKLQSLKTEKDGIITALHKTIQTNAHRHEIEKNENQRIIDECKTQLREARNFCAQQDKNRTSYKIHLTNHLLLLKTTMMRFIKPESIANFSVCYDSFCRSFL